MVLILLPPSETKRDGGEGAPLDFAELSHPRLNARRRALVRAVRALSKDPVEARRALRLGPRGDADIERNRLIARSATMPAIDRYTGVLYDGLAAHTLSAEARERAGSSLVVHSAMFGLVGALDPIPAYRLSHDSRLPGYRLGEHWRAAIGRELAARQELIVDLRSEGYADLGPLPRRENAVYVRVLTRGERGETTAAGHFNKAAKGRFTRALLDADELPESVAGLLELAPAAGFELRRAADGELALII